MRCPAPVPSHRAGDAVPTLSTSASSQTGNTTPAMLSQRCPPLQAAKQAYSSLLVLDDSFPGTATLGVVTKAESGPEYRLLYQLFWVLTRPCSHGKVRLLGFRVQRLGLKGA